MANIRLPTTMVGSYPRPGWFRYQLEGRDILEAFKVIHHAEAFEDAVRTVLKDQEEAGLDLVTDGQMYFDDYSMGIGSFLWYWLERIGGFGKEKLPHPARSKAGADAFALDEAGGVAVRGPIERGPVRLAELYRIAQRNTRSPVKACVGAGPVQLSTLAHFEGGPIKDRYALAYALADVFRAEIHELVLAGCRHVQLEDLGAWIPNLSGEKDFDWVKSVVRPHARGGLGRDVLALLPRQRLGQPHEGDDAGGVPRVLPRYFDVDVRQFVLDFACREMEGVEVLRDLPHDKTVAVGVIDVRSLEVEEPEQVAERVRKVLKVIEPERVTLTTDCGMKQLPRPCAVQKLKALVEGARIVRREL